MNQHNHHLLGAGLVLAMVLVSQPVSARTEAAATPVPFPEAPAQQAGALPGQAALQDALNNMQKLLDRADAYTHSVHTATEKFRAYVIQVQKILASCQVDADLQRAANSPFKAVFAGEAHQCDVWAAAYKQRARRYAARLDQAVAFAELVLQASASAQRQVNRIRLMQHGRQLNAEVQAGFEAIDQAQQALDPWMSP